MPDMRISPEQLGKCYSAVEVQPDPVVSWDDKGGINDADYML